MLTTIIVPGGSVRAAALAWGVSKTTAARSIGAGRTSRFRRRRPCNAFAHVTRIDFSGTQQSSAAPSWDRGCRARVPLSIEDFRVKPDAPASPGKGSEHCRVGTAFLTSRRRLFQHWRSEQL